MYGNSEKKYKIISALDRPDLPEISREVVLLSWPEFMLHDNVAVKLFPRLYEIFPEYQFGYYEPGENVVMALGNSIPLFWDGKPEDLPDKGWDWALQKGFNDQAAGKIPNILCALAIAIFPAYREMGLSGKVLKVMKSIGKSRDLAAMIAPVRPFLKSQYPLTPMEQYIKWRDDDGRPFDNWLRVHAREGARIMKVCPQSMEISGTVKEWEEWTGMRFPESGSYIIHGALVPVEIDCQADRGTYIEPNVWMYHLIS